MASKAKLNVQSFPRPPLLERTNRHLQVKWNGVLIADTKEAYWVLETHHPPTYYLPPNSLRISLARDSRNRQTFCEWKGMASYHAVRHPDTGEKVQGRIWSYEQPTPPFAPIKDYVSLYAEPWDCYVDGEKVQAQPGDFYGGWVTSNIEGIVKGAHGNFDPVV